MRNATIKIAIGRAARLLLTAGALLGATMGNVAAQELPKQPVPIEIKMKWTGKSCNKEGKIQVSLKNISRTPINIPIGGTLGDGGMFVARVTIKGDNEVYATQGHGFKVPHYLGPTMAAEKITALAPGKSVVYDFQLAEPDTTNSLDFFSPPYAEFVKKGGKLGVYYALRKFTVRSDLTDNMYFVGDDLFPAIDTNTLYC